MKRGCPFDPPAELAQLRTEKPISRVRLWDGSSPWLVTRYEDVRSVLADPRVSADTDRPGYPATSAAILARRKNTRSFIGMDDPEHSTYRKMLISDFTVRRTGAPPPRPARPVGRRGGVDAGQRRAARVPDGPRGGQGGRADRRRAGPARAAA